MAFVDGQNWVGINSVCRALGVNENAQRRFIREDPNLSQLGTNQYLVAADGSRREMLCLPEYAAIFWIGSIQVKRPLVAAARMTCIKALYEYVHGPTQKRTYARRRQLEINNELKRLRAERSMLDIQIRIDALIEERKALQKQITVVEKETPQLQLEFDDDTDLVS